MLAVQVFTLAALAAVGLATSDRDERLFLANQATTTQLTLSFVTTTVPYSCYTMIKNDACKRRRSLRNRASLPAPLVVRADALESSQGGASVDKSNNRAERKFFTVWNTAFSTGTVTTTITNTAVTISISAACVPAGFTVPNTC